MQKVVGVMVGVKLFEKDNTSARVDQKFIASIDYVNLAASMRIFECPFMLLTCGKHCRHYAEQFCPP